MRISEGQLWYRTEYLASDWWEKVKQKAWQRGSKCCEICGKRYHLRPHHLSYDRIYTDDEYLDVYYVCTTHHWLCHWSWLGMYQIPLKRRDLTRRFLQLKRQQWWRRLRPSDVINWFIESYKIGD
jgi:hypothetical protein